MSVARSYVRLAISGFLVGLLAVGCVVESTDTKVSCNPGDKKDCSCADGSDGSKTCAASGDAYTACKCTTTGSGGSANEGGDGSTTTAGTKAYAGGGNGGSSYSGSTNYGGDNAGGAPVEMVGGAGAGGAAGEVTPLECQEPMNDCETCYFGGCCEQYAPCVNDPDETCLGELAQVLACTDDIKMTKDVKTSDLESCAQMVGNTNGTWSASLSPLTVDVINCIAGEPGWEGKAWGPLACKASCFDK